MRAIPLLALMVGLLPAAAAAAQELPPSLRVGSADDAVSVEVSMHRGYPAYPAWTLRSLGARVDGTPRGTRVVFESDSLESDTLDFDSGSPFFRAAGKRWQLVEPPYREGGVFYLPHQLFTEWLPERYPERLRYSGGHLRLGSVAVAGGPDGEGPLGEPAPERPIVVIDPGHGGPDPGAVGPSGIREKDIVLQVSKRLAQILADRGYDVRMTRTTDTLIDLEDRPHLANEWRSGRPGLFLSIHANNVNDRRVRGFETFFLSDARTEDERRVAEMENAAVAYESSSRVVGDDDLGFIRNSLLNESYIRASYDLAGMVQDEFGEFHQGRNRGVKQAGFIVLIGAFMPAVLVELAFISNPQEERLLASGSFQVRLSESIADAVDRFFEKQGERWSGASR